MTELPLQPDDLTEDEKRLVELVGLPVFQELIKIYGGSYIYIPKPDRFERITRNQRITQEFDGYNFRELGVKYNLTDTQIRSIVKDKVKVIRARPMDGQLSLFRD